MMTHALTGRTIPVLASRRKHPLPPPLGGRTGILASNCSRQLHPSHTGSQVPLVSGAYPRQVATERRDENLRQHRPAVAIPFPTMHYDLPAGEVEILDA